MTFANPIVGGNTLIREAIQSPNYVVGTSGWTINRDGSAEFNDVTVRGGFQIGTGPSPPSAYIRGEILAGVPTISIYDGTHAVPARIQGFDLGDHGGLVLDTGDVAIETAGMAIGGSIAEVLYQSFAPSGETALVHVGPPFGAAIKLRATGGGANDLEFGLDQLSTTPDTAPGRLYTYGELKLNDLNPDTNYPTRTVDGRANPATLVTTIGVADTLVVNALVSGCYLQDGFAYRATVHIDSTNANVGGRLEWKLWDGTVGASGQLGGTNRRWSDNTAAGANLAGTVLIFVWRQVGTGSGTLSLSAIKTLVTAGAATAATNNAYSILIEQIGDANAIAGL